MIVPGDFLPQHAARSLQYAALNLVAQAFGIGNWSTVVSDDKPRGLHLSALLINFYFSDQRGVSVVAFVGHASDTTSADRASARSARSGIRTHIPLRRLGGCFHGIADSHLFQVLQPIGNWIGLGLCTHLVHKTFVRQSVLQAQRGSQGSGEERRIHLVRQYSFTADRARAGALAVDASRNV